MKKKSQSLMDFLQTLPLSSFVLRPTLISNKEAETLHTIWLNGEKDEYGKHIIPNEVDSMQVTSLTSKGYIRNQPSRFATRDCSPTRLCEFTDKGKDVIKKIILFKEKSALEKSSKIDYEALLMDDFTKTASRQQQPRSWLERVYGNCS